jgi:hypothetical protein
MHALDMRYDAITMRVVFRFLLWLSITVLSLQGGAAMAAGHEMAAPKPAVSDHCKPAKPASASPASASPAHAKCAACADCCIGASAPPALPPGFHVPSLAAALHALPEAAITSFIPATLERPPRNDFA